MIVDQSQDCHILPLVWVRRLAMGIIVGALAFNVHAQTYSLNSVKIQLLNKENLKGQLIKMTSDSLFMKMKGGKIRAINYRSVDFVKMQPYGGVENGILIGAGAGLAVGVVAGVAASDGGSGGSNNYWSGLNGVGQSVELLGTGLIGALSGAMLGAIIGSHPKKIPIRGSRNSYEELRTRCLLSLWKNAEKEKKKP